MTAGAQEKRPHRASVLASADTGTIVGGKPDLYPFREAARTLQGGQIDGRLLAFPLAEFNRQVKPFAFALLHPEEVLCDEPGLSLSTLSIPHRSKIKFLPRVLPNCGRTARKRGVVARRSCCRKPLDGEVQLDPGGPVLQAHIPLPVRRK